MSAYPTADAPPCPPWCTEPHEPIVGGWEADSVQMGYLYKQCRAWLPILDGLSEHQHVSVDRWACLTLERDLDQTALALSMSRSRVYLCDSEMTIEQAEALAGQLLEAAGLARSEGVR